MFIFLAIYIWPLVIFSHKLEHFTSKIAQWDSHWNCEKRDFWDWFQIQSDSLWMIYFYILWKFKIWASKCNKPDSALTAAERQAKSRANKSAAKKDEKRKQDRESKARQRLEMTEEQWVGAKAVHKVQQQKYRKGMTEEQQEQEKTNAQARMRRVRKRVVRVEWRKMKAC